MTTMTTDASTSPTTLTGSQPQGVRPAGKQRVLICGHRSFAARGLIDGFVAAGHEAIGFTRGQEGFDPKAADGPTVTGPVDLMHTNPHLAGDFDTVVNYILLKDDTREKNNEFLASLLRFCKEHNVRHIIHISSMSSFAADEKMVTEDARSETNPDKKGAYGSLKVCTDQYLINNTPNNIALTFFRPGFILGEGVADPIVGTGTRMWNNKLMVLGNAYHHIPVTTRQIVSEAVLKSAELPLDTSQRPRMFVLADNKSPTRREFLQACCTHLGAGTGVLSFPVWLWLSAAYCGWVGKQVVPLPADPYKVITALCRGQSYNADKTARTLGINQSVDWVKELVESFDNQKPNFKAPHTPAPLSKTTAGSVNILGFGGIVKQKHLPGLQKIGFKGKITGYDLKATTDKSGVEVKAIQDAIVPAADLHIVATPGPIHNRSIKLLRDVPGPILVEKPLCYTLPEFEEWLAFSKARQHPVYVLHNYRFKQNVSRFLEHIRKFNPGKLHQVDMVFQSPSVMKDVPWRRDERRARTLLMDYALHFLDLAMMFHGPEAGEWDLKHARHEINRNGHTSIIQGQFQSATCGVSFTMRQGFFPRRCKLFYTFENYGVDLGFFPDTFVPYQTSDMWGLYDLESKENFRKNIRKVADKLTKKDSDDSHPLAFCGALGDQRLGPSMTLQTLEPFYRGVFKLSEAVYG
jgi:nucleoside-diphosphate-sugar epimerase